MGTQKFHVHELFTCECGKDWQDYTNARRRAYAHAMQTGHKVRGEVGVAYHYHFPKSAPTSK